MTDSAPVASKPSPLQTMARFAVIICAVVSATVAVQCKIWLDETEPFMIENPAPSTQIILNPRIHAGDLVYTSRSLRITKSCPVEIGVWFSDASGQPIYPRGEYRTYIAKNDFSAAHVGYETMRNLPPGDYEIENYVACQVNLLTLLTAHLRPLRFTIVPPDQPL